MKIAVLSQECQFIVEVKPWAPNSYLEEGNDDTLHFTDTKEETEEVAEDTPDFLLDDDGPEDEVASEDEILEDIKEDSEESEDETEIISKKEDKEEKPKSQDL